MKTNPRNIKIKRQYLQWLRDAEGWSQSTINQIALTISFWEEFIGGRDFRQFDAETVQRFKKWLEARINPVTKKPLTPITLRSHMTPLKGFYKWLSSQTGYKSKILATDHRYFQLDNKLNRIALNRPKKRMPTLEIIKKIVASIKLKTEVDWRDQAMIAFAFLSGMRIEALISLRLGNFDVNRLRVVQDPADGVKTKFSKMIITTLFDFDHYLLNVVKSYVTFLRKKKLFTDVDPMFPATKTVQESPDEYNFAASDLDRKPWVKTNSAREVWKKRCRAAGVEYFSPHSFRHAAVKEAIDRCKTPADLKAVSLNIGHSKIPTTLFQYGYMSDEDRDVRIKNLKADAETDGEVLRQIRDEIKTRGRGVSEDILLSYAADRDLVQSMAGANCGRLLTEKEIKRLKYGFAECDEAYDALMTAVIAVIEFVMDNKDGQWNQIDADGEKDTK